LPGGEDANAMLLVFFQELLVVRRCIPQSKESMSVVRGRKID
jgi:hypothetical protein